jgi:hypothetical protein
MKRLAVELFITSVWAADREREEGGGKRGGITVGTEHYAACKPEGVREYQ